MEYLPMVDSAQSVGFSLNAKCCRPHSPVINRPESNNVAFTNAKLGMHNDLAQYEHMPGVSDPLSSSSIFPSNKFYQLILAVRGERY